jgi:gas vesicle protein
MFVNGLLIGLFLGGLAGFLAAAILCAVGGHPRRSDDQT